MLEPEAILAAHGMDQPPPREASQPPVDRRELTGRGQVRLTAARANSRPATAPRSEEGALLGVEAVEPARKQRF